MSSVKKIATYTTKNFDENCLAPALLGNNDIYY